MVPPEMALADTRAIDAPIVGIEYVIDTKNPGLLKEVVVICPELYKCSAVVAVVDCNKGLRHVSLCGQVAIVGFGIMSHGADVCREVLRGERRP